MAAIQHRITHVLLVFVLLALLAVIGMLATGVRGGPLDPPGTPGPTLPQVEPRKPIPPVGWDGTFPIQISTAGSYFLTRDIAGVDGIDGIVISSRDVSLDLNGFLLDGSGINPSDAIVVTAAADRGVEIRNGMIKEWNGTGIDASAATGVRISDVRISFQPLGISAGPGSVVEDCTVRTSGGTGIRINGGVVRRCSVFDNQLSGIHTQGSSLIEDNMVFNNGSGPNLNRSNILVEGEFNAIQDNVVLTPNGGAPAFRINSNLNMLIRNYYRCNHLVAVPGPNYVPGAQDFVDTNYCW